MGRLIAYLFAGFCVLSLMYSNCGRVGEGGLIIGSSSLNSAMSKNQVQCEVARKDVYMRTFFPFLRNTCTTCHQHTQTHASQDSDVSFAAFMQTGQQTIIYQATHPHGGNSFGSANQATINAFLPEWTDANDAYVACLASAGEQTGPVKIDIPLASQTIADIEKTRTNNAIWVPVSFDFGSPVSGKLTLEAQYWQNVRGEAIGLLIRKPRIKLAAAQDPIRFQGLHVLINETHRQSATMYANLNLTLTAGTDTLLSGGTEAIGIDGVTSTIRLGLRIMQVEKNPSSTIDPFQPLPTPPPRGTPVATPTPTGVTVTFNDLVNGAPTLKIFGNSCVQCHRPGSLGGGLDLTNYSAASASASLILARMKSSTAPMPRTGKLPAAQIEKVEAWIAGGKPR